MLLSLPTTVRLSRKTKFALNLNQYRNTHFSILNNAKIAFKKAIEKLVKGLPQLTNVNLTYTLYPRTRQRCDVANVCSIVDKFFSDALVEFGILPDDNYDHLPKVVYQFGSIDKTNPRVDVLIESLDMTKTPSPTPPTKEQDPMQITLNESEIKRAIAEFVTNRMDVDLNQSVEIDLKATRGQEGFTASFDVTPRQRFTEAKLSEDKAPQDGAVEEVSKPTHAYPAEVTEKPAEAAPAPKAVSTPKTTAVAPQTIATTKPKSLFGSKVAATPVEPETQPEETVEEPSNISSGADDRIDPMEATTSDSQPSDTSDGEQDADEQQDEAPQYNGDENAAESEEAASTPEPEVPAKKPIFSFAKKT